MNFIPQENIDKSIKTNPTEKEKKMVKDTIEKHIVYGRRPRKVKKILFENIINRIDID